MKIFVSLALCLSVSMAGAQGMTERVAKVIRLKGSARYTTGNYSWTPLKVGDVLRAGMAVQTSTDEGSYVDLALGDGSMTPPQAVLYTPHIRSSMTPSPPILFQRSAEQNVVRVWSDSAVGIDKLAALQTGEDIVSETQLDVKRGRMTGNVKKLSAGSKYEVKFPNGVAQVRGTLFDIQAVGIVKVYIGSLVVAWVDPRTQQVSTQTIMGGQSYEVAANQVSLLSADNMHEFSQLSDALLPGQLVVPSPTMLATDRTVIGMSPVGANPAHIPNPEPPNGD
jgi:hypothetical protein